MKCAVLFVVAAVLSAQEPGFQVQSRVVLVPVTVTDKKGRFVENLEAADFLLLDNGRTRKPGVDTFATGVAPIALVIAVQSSGISAPVLAKVQKIGAMIQPLITGERGCAALVSFASRVEWLQECTNDPAALSNAFNRIRPAEPKDGRMLDAVHSAIGRLHARPNVRRVLLLISESRDRGSETSLRSAVLEAQASDVSVYAATYSAFQTAFTQKQPDYQTGQKPKGPQQPERQPESSPSRIAPAVPPPEQRVDLLGGFGELIRLGKANTAQALVNSTGGSTFPFLRQKGLEDAVGKLGAELHTQYVLSFVPEGAQAGLHNLEVRIPARPDLMIRARPSYWWTRSMD